MPHVVQNTKKFGRLVRNRRVEKNLTQKELGDKCGMSKNAISKIELGQTGPNESNFRKLTKILDISTENLDKPKTEKENMMEAIEEIGKKTELILEKLGKVETGLSETQTAQMNSQDHGIVTDQEQFVAILKNMQDRLDKLESKSSELESESKSDNQHNTILEYIEKYKGTGDEIGIIDSLFDSGKKRKLKNMIYVDCCNIAEREGINPHQEIKSNDEWDEKSDIGNEMTNEIFKYACDDQSLSDTYNRVKEILNIVNDEGGEEPEEEVDLFKEYLDNEKA